jgi:hypothetical protein
MEFERPDSSSLGLFCFISLYLTDLHPRSQSIWYSDVRGAFTSTTIANQRAMHNILLPPTILRCQKNHVSQRSNVLLGSLTRKSCLSIASPFSGPITSSKPNNPVRWHLSPLQNTRCSGANTFYTDFGSPRCTSVRYITRLVRSFCLAMKA